MSQLPRIMDPEPPADQSHSQRLEQLPNEIGFLMIGIGFVGLIFPGPFGTPLMIAGGLSLWPATFRPADRWMARKFPNSHASGARWLERFMDDLDRRYPEKAQATSGNHESIHP